MEYFKNRIKYQVTITGTFIKDNQSILVAGITDYYPEGWGQNDEYDMYLSYYSNSKTKISEIWLSNKETLDKHLLMLKTDFGGKFVKQVVKVESIITETPISTEEL